MSKKTDNKAEQFLFDIQGVCSKYRGTFRLDDIVQLLKTVIEIEKAKDIKVEPTRKECEFYIGDKKVA